MKFILYMIFSTVLMGCNNLQPQHQKIKKAHNIILYSVQSTPTEPGLQLENKLYVADFEVIETIAVTPEEIAQLKKAFTDLNNYTFDTARRCPFMAKYAVDFDNTLTAVVGMHPCSKIILSSKNKTENKTIDMVNDNNIEKILKIIDD